MTELLHFIASLVVGSVVIGIMSAVVAARAAAGLADTEKEPDQ